MARTYRIVVGVDGSEGGRRALDWALADAARHRGVVHVVLAWDGKSRQWPAGTDAAAAEAALGTLLTEVRASYPAVPLTGDMIPGQAAEVLVRAAHTADLLVLGSHGHSRLFHAVLGSVTEECIRAATCPVAVIPAPRGAPPPDREGSVTTAVC